MGLAARHIQIGQAHADELLADGLLLCQWQISFEDVFLTVPRWNGPGAAFPGFEVARWGGDVHMRIQKANDRSYDPGCDTMRTRSYSALVWLGSAGKALPQACGNAFACEGIN